MEDDVRLDVPADVTIADQIAGGVEPNVKQVVPFFWVTNMERSLQYYVEGLGFTRVKQWIVDGNIRWCWLTLGGAALMLQEFSNKLQQTFASFSKLGEGVSLCFECDDAVALYHEFRGRGIEASEPEVGNSLWDTGLTDPDGYRLHFSSPTDLPEDTKLSEVG